MTSSLHFHLKRILKRLLFFSLFTLCYTVLEAQNSVSGNVKGFDGEPLVGVSVIVKESSKGTITDLNGNYNIDAEKNKELIFSYMGYKSQQISVKNNIINIILEEDNTLLNEVSVTNETIFTSSVISANNFSKFGMVAVRKSA